MEPEKPVRGRARGRARAASPAATPAEQEEEAGPSTRAVAESGSSLDSMRGQFAETLPTCQEGGEERVEKEGVYVHMFAQGEKRTREGGNGGSGSGSGQDEGGGNGNGNGNGGKRGRRSSSSEGGRNGSPRGAHGQGAPGGEYRMPDYVRSRPSPDFDKAGKTGRNATIIANYYQFRKHPEFQMTLHTIKVEPEVEENWIVKKLIRTRAAQIGAYILSGRQLFATRPLAEEVMSFNAALEDAPDRGVFNVVLEFKRNVGESEGVVVQFYNIVVREMQEMMQYKLLGRHYFDPEQRVPFASWKLELWPGFSNSIRQQESALMLNVESCWKVLQTESVLRKMAGIRQQYQANYKEQCNAEIVGMMVITMYNKKAYKISRIDFDANPNSTFETKRGPKQYVDYYRERHNVTISNLAQPMLVSEPKLRDIRRGQTNDIYLVPELCFPCGLNEELRGNFRLMKDLASCLHMAPSERVQTMQNFIRGVSDNQEIQRTIRSWGIQVAARPVELPGRYLPPERIICGGEQVILPDDKADWTNPLTRSQKMRSSAKLGNWAVVVTARDGQGIGNLISTMQRVSTPLGYQISQPIATIRINDTRAASYVQGVNDAMAKCGGKVDMIFVILASNNADVYAAVKKRCSCEFGVPSQCFLSKHLNNARGLMSICTKMVIQMNAKQGGEPWGVANPLKTIMVLGYDVHHAGPKGGMSVGAMTATITPTLGRYFSTVAKLPSREEVATAVTSMFEKCLTAYAEMNQRLPDRILMYRDGVGEGQLEDVYTQELQGFKDRIKARYAEKGQGAPKLTYIVVNKRINTRFFECAGRDSYNNPKPGLVVDNTVTRPERYDFFLISQTARQGCVGPTYYNVLLDESGLDADKIQLYTYKMCHLYFNWTGTVAVPGPCQNAHKLAFLVGTALRRPANNSLQNLLHFL